MKIPKQEKQELTNQNDNTDHAKNEMQRELNDATQRLDYLRASSVKTDSL
jgi:hypothetical protein